MVTVAAEHRDLRTVIVADRCLKASVSDPPPARSNSCRSMYMAQNVFPLPLSPLKTENKTKLISITDYKICRYILNYCIRMVLRQNHTFNAKIKLSLNRKFKVVPEMDKNKLPYIN